MLRPIKVATSNLVYRGNGQDVADLPCERRVTPQGSAIYSVWEPTPEQRAAIAAGANIELGIWNMEPIPPVSICITNASEIG